MIGKQNNRSIENDDVQIYFVTEVMFNLGFDTRYFI